MARTHSRSLTQPAHSGRDSPPARVTANDGARSRSFDQAGIAQLQRSAGNRATLRALQTPGATEAQATASAEGIDRTPLQRAVVFGGPSWRQISEKSAKQEAVKMAVDLAQSMLVKSEMALGVAGTNPAERQRFERWFGPVERRDQVRSAYRAISGALSNLDVWADLITEPHSTFAYVLGTGSNRIYLCQAFFNSYKNKATIDSTAGTIIHELSHSFVNTDDNTYGTAGAMQLALDDIANDTTTAIENADNYEYFSESLL